MRGLPGQMGLAAGLSFALAALFRGLTMEALPSCARGASAACAAALLFSLLVPVASVGLAAARDLPRWAARTASWAGGSAAGLVAFALLLCRGAAGAALRSSLVVAACALSFGAFGLALARLLRPRVAEEGPGPRRFGLDELAGCLPAAALLVLEALPFWSGPLFRSAAGPSLGKLLVGSSPFMAASLPWVSLSAWSFDPRTSPVLYGLWVGTDVPVAYPSWAACVAGHVLAGCVLLGAVLALERLRGAYAPAGRDASMEHRVPVPEER